MPRWPGSSLIMINGHKHLKQCAYIGDDSSEELDEMFAGDESNNTSVDYDISNKPTNMKTIRDGVVLVGESTDHSDILYNHHRQPILPRAKEELNGKGDIKKGQVHLIYAEQEINPKKSRDKEEYKVNPKIVNIPHNLQKEEPKLKTSKEVYDGILQQLKQMGSKGKVVLKQLNEKLTQEGYEDKNISINPSNDNITNKSDLKNKKRRRRQTRVSREAAISLTKHDEKENHAKEEVK